MRMGKAMGLWLCALVAAIVGLGGVARAADTELREQVAPGQHGGEERTFAQKVQIGQLTQTAEIVLTAAFKFLHVATLSADDSAFWNPARFADERLKATMDATLAAPHDGGFRQRTAGALATGAGGEGDNTFSFASRIDAAGVEALVVLVEWTPDKQWSELPRNGKMMPGTDKDKRKYRITATCGAAGKYEMAVFYAGKEVKTFELQQGKSTYPANGGELILDTFKDPGHGKAEVKIRKKGASDGFLPGAYPFWVGNEALIVRMDRHVGEAVPKGLGKGGAWESLPRHGNVQVAKNPDSGRYEIHDKIKVTLDVPAPTNGDDDQGYELVIVHNGDVKERIAGIGAGDGQEFAIETAKLARDDGNVQPGQGFARLYHGEEQVDEYPFWVCHVGGQVSLEFGNGGYLLMAPKKGGKKGEYAPAGRQPLRLGYLPEELAKGTLALSAPVGGEKIKIFDQEEGGKELRLPQRWPLTDKAAIPTVLYVEGSRLSDEEGDVELRWEYINEYGEAVAEAGVATVCAVEITALESHRKGKPGKPDAWSNLDELTLVVPEGTFGNDQYRCKLTMKPTIQDAEIRVACGGAEVETAEVVKGKETYELDPQKFDDQKFFEKEATLYVRKQGDDKIKLTADKKFHVWPVVQLELKAKKGLLRLDKSRNRAQPAALTKDNHTEVALQVIPNGRVKSGKVTLDSVGGKNVVELRDSLNPNPNVLNLPVTWDVGGNGAAMPNIVHAVASENGVAKLSLTYDNGFGYKGEPRSASMKDADNEAVALENIEVSKAKLMYQKEGEGNTWHDIHDYNDDGEYEIFLARYGDITSLAKDLSGKNPKLRLNFMVDGLAHQSTVTWENATVLARDSRKAFAHFDMPTIHEISATIDTISNKLSVKVYVVEITYSQSNNATGGWDAPVDGHISKDYNYYLSLEKSASTFVNLNVLPAMKHFYIRITPITVYRYDNAMSGNDLENVAVVNGSNEAVYSNSASTRTTISISGTNPSGKRYLVGFNVDVTTTNSNGETIKVLALAEPVSAKMIGESSEAAKAAGLSFCIPGFGNVLYALVLQKKTFDVTPVVLRNCNIGFAKRAVNNLFKPVIYEINNVNTISENYIFDANGNGDLDFYSPKVEYVESTNADPERAAINRGGHNNTNLIVFCSRIVKWSKFKVDKVSREGPMGVVFTGHTVNGFPLNNGGGFFEVWRKTSGQPVKLSVERAKTIIRKSGNSIRIRFNLDNVALRTGAWQTRPGEVLDLAILSSSGTSLKLERAICVATDQKSQNQVNSIVAHELGHLVGNLRDTNYLARPSIMQFNGGSKSLEHFFCRLLPICETSTGRLIRRAWANEWVDIDR